MNIHSWKVFFGTILSISSLYYINYYINPVNDLLVKRNKLIEFKNKIPIFYSVDTTLDFKPSPHRLYKYNIKYLDELILSNKVYHESLFGNYKVKELVDGMLKDYMMKNNIKQKYIVLDAVKWYCVIEIEENKGNEYLVLKLSTDSDEMVKIDAIQHSLEKEIEYKILENKFGIIIRDELR